MKKIYLLSLVFLGFTFQAYSQEGKIFMGGDVGFSVTSFSNQSSSSPSSEYNLDILPTIGYFVSDKLAIGTGLGFSVYGDNYNSNPQVTTATTNFSLSPFVRYSLMEVNNFSLIGQGIVSFGFGGSGSSSGGTTTTGPTTLNFSIGIGPGFQYKVSDKILLESFFGNIGFYYDSTTPKNGTKSSSTKFDFSLSSGLGLGFIYIFN